LSHDEEVEEAFNPGPSVDAELRRVSSFQVDRYSHTSITTTGVKRQVSPPWVSDGEGPDLELADAEFHDNGGSSADYASGQNSRRGTGTDFFTPRASDFNSSPGSLGHMDEGKTLSFMTRSPHVLVTSTPIQVN